MSKLTFTYALELNTLVLAKFVVIAPHNISYYELKWTRHVLTGDRNANGKKQETIVQLW